MTIGFVLKSNSNASWSQSKEIARGFLPILGELWPQDSVTFPMLSEFDLLSPTYYSPADMNELVHELKYLGEKNDKSDVLHNEIAKLINVAHQCRDGEANSMLVMIGFMEMHQ